MKTCEVCSESVSKYRCPGCSMETCCLKCVNQHKQDKQCDGQRDKTAYVKMTEFTDLNLLNDYRFLEDAGRKSSNAGRDELKRKHNVPNFLKELDKQAKKRNLRLRLMPYPMSRRKNNSTIYQHKLKKILWHIEWIFPQASYTVTDRRVNEDDTLASILDRHMGPDADPLVKHKLKCYTSVEQEKLGIFLKHDSLETSQISYYRLDISKSIHENLQNTQIVEHPTLYVVLEHQFSQYPIVPVILDEPAEVDKDKVEKNNDDGVIEITLTPTSSPSITALSSEPSNTTSPPSITASSSEPTNTDVKETDSCELVSTATVT